MEKNFLSQKDIEKLINGEPAARGTLTSAQVRAEINAQLMSINEQIERVYDLSLLEGKLLVDAYMRSKSEFAILNKPYGWLSAVARRDNGTNTYRFFQMIWRKTGLPVKSSMKMPMGGYTRASLAKVASHDLELNLAVHTEEHFSTLRTLGKALKATQRAIKRAQQTEPTRQGKLKQSTTKRRLTPA